MDAFDPLHLTPTASLNRVRIFDAPPSERWDEQGRLAYDLLSKEALVADLARHAHQLGLDQSEPTSLPQRFGRCFHTDDPVVLEAANVIARRWGERFATLALVLARGDARHRAARPEWGVARWEHWASVEHIWMGGGLCAGPFGAAIVAYAQAYLALRGSRCSLHLAPYPAYLPLLGTARSVPPEHTNALVFDFGGTHVKRGIPHFKGKTLRGLQLLPPVPVALNFADSSDNAQAEETRRFVADTLITTMEAIAPQGGEVYIVASMSAYVANGRILPGQGGRYSALTHGIDDVASWFGQYIERQTGAVVAIDFVHDGTAAARAFAREQNAAVIILGTALGSGFPPPENTVRPIAPTFSIQAF